MKAKRQDILNFIVGYLREHTSADVCNQSFHDEFYKKFGGKRFGENEFYAYGAHPVYKAQSWLRKLYKDGTLDRHTVGIVGAGYRSSGLPKWVYSYTLSSAYATHL